MNVALTLFRYFPHGGMQRDLVATARRLQARGHAVRVYCHTCEGAAPSDVPFEVLPVRGRSNHARALAFATRLRERLAADAPDVVVGFDKMPGLNFYFAADPCFVNRTADRPWLYRLTPRYRTFRSLERAVFGDGGAQVLLLDERERRHYQAAYATPDDRFTLLPPGIARDRRRGDDAAEQRARARRSLQLDERTFVLLMLASNLELKGCDRVLRGLAALPAELRERTALLAVGGAPTAQLRRLVDELGLAANCTFAAGRDDVPDLLQAADLLVHPARRDTTGTVLLEAVAACLPVLCSGAPGYAEHIRRAGAGIALDEPFDQRAFDAALAELRVADLRPRRDAALRYAGEHDLHGMHDRIVDAVEGYSGGGAT